MIGSQSPHALYAIRGAPGENSELFSLVRDPQWPGGRREGGVRFAEVGENSVPGRLVIPGNRQLIIVRRKCGGVWDLVGRSGCDAPLAQAIKVPGRKRFLLRILCEDGDDLNEFVVDGEARGRRVRLYRHGEPRKYGEREALIGTVFWGRFRRGDDVGNGGVVRLERYMEADSLLFSVWLSMLLWRKRPVGGRNECLSNDALPGTMRRTEWSELMSSFHLGADGGKRRSLLRS